MTDLTTQLAEALRDAVRSLETIGRLAGKPYYGRDEQGEPIPTYMGHNDEVRGYANSRAGVARAALAAHEAALRDLECPPDPEAVDRALAEPAGEAVPVAWPSAADIADEIDALLPMSLGDSTMAAIEEWWRQLVARKLSKLALAAFDAQQAAPMSPNPVSGTSEPAQGELPPLPAGEVDVWFNGQRVERAFTADQMHAYARAALASQPAARGALTDEQIFADDGVMALNATLGADMDLLMRLVRAIERAHGITAPAAQEGNDAR